DRPLVDDDGRDVFIRVDRPEDAGEVPGAFGAAHDAQPGAVQLHLADGELAVEELFLVVVEDAGGDVEELRVVRVVGAGQPQVADGEAAEQAELGRLEGDADALELAGELVGDQAAHGGRVGPALVEDGAGGQAGDDGEHQRPDQPFAAGAEPLSGG